MNIHQKINEVTRRVNYVVKDARVSTYKAVTIQTVTRGVQAAMLDVGLNLQCAKIERYDTPHPKGRIVVVVAYYKLFCSDSGEYIEIMSTGEGFDSLDKASGKAITNAYKYALIRAFNLVVENEEDPDLYSSDAINKGHNHSGRGQTPPVPNNQQYDITDIKSHKELLSECFALYCAIDQTSDPNDAAKSFASEYQRRNLTKTSSAGWSEFKNELLSIIEGGS